MIRTQTCEFFLNIKSSYYETYTKHLHRCYINK